MFFFQSSDISTSREEDSPGMLLVYSYVFLSFPSQNNVPSRIYH